jgi:ribosomal protein S12 methylthiotransferase accessory factor
LGHILQVSNGKGLTFEEAAQGALLEAAELHASERPPADLLFTSARELRRLAADRVWSLDRCGSAGRPLKKELAPDEVHQGWAHGEDLFSGDRIWAPAQALFCPPGTGPWIGPSMLAWTSNGMGAHSRIEWALDHALREAVERHQLARALPRGWTRASAGRRRLSSRAILDAAPEADRLKASLEKRGFGAAVFDLRADIALPTAGAWLIDREAGPIPLTAGYACGLSWSEAIRGALLEAAQSRLTDIHGAREDIALTDPGAAAQLRVWEGDRASTKPRLTAPPSPRRVKTVLAALRTSGYAHAAVFELGNYAGARVVKVIVPGFQISHLL